MKERVALRTIYVVSAVVFIAVIILFNLPRVDNPPTWIPYLPLLNAVINASCSVLLIASFLLSAKEYFASQTVEPDCLLLSSLFLVSYIVFHAFGVETRFPAENPLRPFYLVILISHIILAAGFYRWCCFRFTGGLWPN